MSEPPEACSILIVDDDVGFVWWLGEAFSEAGCQTVPAVTTSQALSLARELELKIDMVIVNPGLAGVEAMIRSLEPPGRSLKVIIIRDQGATDDPGFHYNGALERPSGMETIKRSEWVQKLRELLRQVHLKSL